MAALWKILTETKLSTWHYRQWRLASHWYPKVASFLDDKVDWDVVFSSIIENEFKSLKRVSEPELNFWQAMSGLTLAKQAWFQSDFELSYLAAGQAAKKLKDAPWYLARWLWPHVRAWQSIGATTWLKSDPSHAFFKDNQEQFELLGVFWATDAMRCHQEFHSKHFRTDRLLLSTTVLKTIPERLDVEHWKKIQESV